MSTLPDPAPIRLVGLPVGYDRHPAVHHLDGTVRAGALRMILTPFWTSTVSPFGSTVTPPAAAARGGTGGASAGGAGDAGLSGSMGATATVSRSPPDHP